MIMHSEDWKHVIICALVLGSICFSIHSCSHMVVSKDQEYTAREKQMIDAGYKKDRVPTGYTDVWVSPDAQE